MALGRREAGAILLGAAAIVFYLVLLSTTPSDAQTGGSTTSFSRTTNQNQYFNDQPSNRTTSASRTVSVNAQKPPEGRTVINVPDKPLPPSGGLPVYGVVLGSVVGGAGLVALALAIRRGTQG